MPIITAEINIDAPVTKVWQILLDFEAYGQWNPFITEVIRTSDKQLKVTMVSNNKTTIFNPTIYIEKQETELRWLGKLAGLPFLFTGEHYFLLSISKKGTHLIQGEKFSGLLTYLLWPFIKNEIQNNFQAMNQALKVRVEG